MLASGGGKLVEFGIGRQIALFWAGEMLSWCSWWLINQNHYGILPQSGSGQIGLDLLV